ATLDNSMRTVMTSFNTINSIPTSVDKISFKEILKVKKGFFGFIISDWTSIGEMNPFIITVNPTSRFDM
ncbi:glycoside hydrolase family 3 N-terminal domain-containing protein, partial [Epilithonimonas hominis]